MCRSIKTLFNFEPPATEPEIKAAALQFVRKLSGFNSPSKINDAAFERAVEEMAASAPALLGSLITYAEPRACPLHAIKAVSNRRRSRCHRLRRVDRSHSYF